MFHQIASASVCVIALVNRRHIFLLFTLRLVAKWARNHFQPGSKGPDFDLAQKRCSEYEIGIKLHFGKTEVHNANKKFHNYEALSDVGRSWRPCISCICGETQSHMLSIRFVQRETGCFACQWYNCELCDPFTMFEQ